MDANCHNTLELKGDEKEIARFVKTIKGYNGEDVEEFIIGDFLAYPKEFFNKDALMRKQLKKKYGFDDFDDWCVANWGTTENCEWASYDKKTHILEFSSYDSPPNKAIALISKLFPSLTFNFSYIVENKNVDESVADFGSFVYQDGKIKSEEYYKAKIVKCPECKQIMAHTKL